MWDTLHPVELVLLLLLHLLAWGAAGHAVLTKRDPRSALGWSAALIFLPVVGLLLYLAFGISRTQSAAQRMLRRLAAGEPYIPLSGEAPQRPERIPEQAVLLERLGRRLTGLELCGGNRIEPLRNGNEAYPAMLRAIHAARERVYLSSYIFAYGSTAEAFCEALALAAARGVDVRVLVDGFGGRFYSLRRPWAHLAARGVRVAQFLPLQLLPPKLCINLRTHRKLLVCDGVAFTGGMNISDHHVLSGRKGDVQDMHFRCCGPIVHQLLRAFLLDWGFACGSPDPVPVPAVPAVSEGDSLCRLVLDGPDSDDDTLNDLMAGAISGATRSVHIMTPYFLPSHELMTSLRSAAQRGLDVRVILPERNNLPYVHWASFRLLPSLLRAGVRVWHQPPPFAHTKLLAVDGYYAQIGSANLDARSLRLNFELNMEVFDPQFHDLLVRHMREAAGRGREMTLSRLAARSLPLRLRDAACWLFSPYL